MRPDDRTRRLLRGKLRRRVNTASWLFFTVHKSASAYVADLFARLANSERLIPIDLEGYVFRHSERGVEPYVSEEFLDHYHGRIAHGTPPGVREVKRIIPSRGFYFGAIRARPFYHRIPHFSEFKALLMLRDPRDVLTSRYFSIAYSHPLPSGNVAERDSIAAEREQAKEIGIDEYVLNMAPYCAEIYTDYCREVLGRPNVLFVKYEDMVRDFPAWLDQALEFWNVRKNTPTVARILDAADFSVSREDPYSHKRQVQPGDHRRKLHARTIRRLDATFEHILDGLGYERGGRAYARAS